MHAKGGKVIRDLKTRFFFLKKKLNFVTKGFAVTKHPVNLITLVGNITFEKITHLILSWFHSYRIICKCLSYCYPL